MMVEWGVPLLVGIGVGFILSLLVCNIPYWQKDWQESRRKQKVKHLNEFLHTWWRDAETHWLLLAMVRELSRKRSDWEKEQEEK